MLEVDYRSKADLGRYKSLLKGRKLGWLVHFGHLLYSWIRIRIHIAHTHQIKSVLSNKLTY
jgi:hypothetical protein